MMKIRTLIISDIHGCYDEFNALLKQVGYNPYEDQLVLLGDYVDRGQKSKEVVEQIRNLVKDYNVIALRGNHDQMFLDALNNDEDYIFLHNGGIHTIESYCGLNWFEDCGGFDYERYIVAKKFIKSNYGEHIDFLESLPHYHEDDSHIYVHAGLNPSYENWREQPVENFIWIRDIFLNNRTGVDKTVIFGHTPTVNLQETSSIWFSGDKIGVGGGCCFGYALNCLEISQDGYLEYSVKRGSK
jgi:serine/threonine protein phosphatase 1